MPAHYNIDNSAREEAIDELYQALVDESEAAPLWLLALATEAEGAEMGLDLTHRRVFGEAAVRADRRTWHTICWQLATKHIDEVLRDRENERFEHHHWEDYA